ncbi:MAG: hypothetical protein WCC22_03095 [Terriglobales bacterium]
MVTSVTAGIAAVLVLSLGFLSPVFGLVALLVITPFQPFIDFYAPSLGSVYAGAALRDGLLVVISLRWILSRWFSEAAPQLTIPEKVALLYLILAIVWIPIAPSFAGALVGYRNMVGFIVLLFVAAKAMSVRDRSAVLLKVFLVVALCSALVGIIESLTFRAVFDLIHYDVTAVLGPIDYGSIPRATGGTGNALDFGLYMAIAATLSSALLSGRAPFPRWLLWLVLTATSLAVVLTLSRAAYIALTLGVLGTGVLLRPKRIWIAVGILAVMGLLAAVTPVAEIFSDRLLFNDSAGIQTATERAEIARDIFSSPSIWLGDGLGTVGAALGRSGVNPKIDVTDNYYGSVLMQMGIVPLLVYLTLLAQLAGFFYKRLRQFHPGASRSFIAATLMIVVVIAVHALFSSALENRAISVVIWTLFGTTIGLSRAANAVQLQPALT